MQGHVEIIIEENKVVNVCLSVSQGGFGPIYNDMMDKDYSYVSLWIVRNM